MANCRYCGKPFEPEMYHGKPTTGCPECRERRAARKHMVVYGYAVVHDEGNGKRPPPVCPVCGELRAVMALCRCERMIEAGSLRPEDLDRDYRARYRDDLPPEFPSQL